MSIDIEAVRVAAGSTPDPEVRCSIAELGLLDEITVEGQRRDGPLPPDLAALPGPFARSRPGDPPPRHGSPGCGGVRGGHPGSLSARRDPAAINSTAARPPMSAADILAGRRASAIARVAIGSAHG